MAQFEKGNQMYLFRLTDGKFKKYTPEEWGIKLKEYFEFMSNQYWYKSEAIKSGDLAGTTMQVETKTPLSRKSLAVFAEISEDTIKNYASNKEGYTDYFDLTTQALNIIDSNQIDGALIGAYNTNLVARLQGIKEEIDHTTNGKDLNNTIPIINVQVNSSKTDFAGSESEVDA